MKTIKVFLASSDELRDERQKFGDLIRRLDDIYVKRGIHVQLLMWEDMDPCYNNVRKQDEYNAWIRQSDIFVCLFHTRAGQYTLEELEVARQEFVRRQEPKLMIYVRDLQPDETEMTDLQEFKQRLEHDLGHFWGHYPTTDKLHLDFVMFLMRSEEGHSDALKVEDGRVMFDGMTVASMDNLPFAADNEGYRDMKQRMEALSVEVEQLWNAVQQAPGIDMLRSMHQQKLNEYNALKEKFASHQQALFATAKRISEMQLEKVSSELRRAITEFESGRVEAANAILDSIEHEADQHMEQLDRDRTLVHQDIEALQLKTKTLMADLTIPIEQRIQQTWDTYKKADDWAERSALPKEKYAKLLGEYSSYLYAFAKYDQALSVLRRKCRMNDKLYGMENPDTAKSYNLIGNVYAHQGNYSQALKYFQKAFSVFEKKIWNGTHMYYRILQQHWSNILLPRRLLPGVGALSKSTGHQGESIRIGAF